MSELTVPAVRNADEFPTSKIRTRAEAEAYVASVCFKHGPPKLHGVELEWTVHHEDDPRRPLDPDHLRDALGAHAPHSLAPDSAQLPLPHGSNLTLEPGGQVEVSSLPSRSTHSLFGAVAADAAYLHELLRAAGLTIGQHGTDAWREPHRILQVPRYAAMECAFDRIGVDGRLMMCSTAGVQVCLDSGEADRVAIRWAALHALGPVMMATFANSPRLGGRHTGWCSSRTRALLRTDPQRMRPGPMTADPAASWAKRVLDTRLLCVRRDGADWRAPAGVSFADWINGALPTTPTLDDLDYHLSTMFPPVRPRGYLEVRYLDAQVGTDWMLPAAALIALFREESTVDEVVEVAAPAVGRWMDAARHGLEDPGLAKAARAVFDLACDRMNHPDIPQKLAEALAEAVDSKLVNAERAGGGSL